LKSKAIILFHSFLQRESKITFMSLRRYQLIQKYWRGIYWNRYLISKDNVNQPDRFLFKEKIKKLENWIGKKYRKDRHQHSLYFNYSNLTSWSSHWFIWLITFLELIESENKSLFKKLIAKLESNTFSLEFEELIQELAFLSKVMNLSEIDIDPVFENNQNPDIIVKSAFYGDTIIEVTRLELSEEQRYCRSCIDSLSILDQPCSFINYGYRFNRKPEKNEWNDFMIELEKQLLEESEVILFKNDFITLVADPIKPPNIEKFRNLCKDANLEFGDRSGWEMPMNNAQRIIKKIKKKNKYKGLKLKFLLSLYGIEDLLFFNSADDVSEFIAQISNSNDFPVKLNYRYMFEWENRSRNLRGIERREYKIENSITYVTFFNESLLADNNSLLSRI
jgi:hypothetical protein